MLEEFKARIALLLEEMDRRPEDAHEVQERLREQLEGLKGLGMPLPRDLVDLERLLEADLEEGVRPGAEDTDRPPSDA